MSLKSQASKLNGQSHKTGTRWSWISVVATPLPGCEFSPGGFRFPALAKGSLVRGILLDSVSFRIMKTCLSDKGGLYKLFWILNVLVSSSDAPAESPAWCSWVCGIELLLNTSFYFIWVLWMEPGATCKLHVLLQPRKVFVLFCWFFCISF